MTPLVLLVGLWRAAAQDPITIAATAAAGKAASYVGGQVVAKVEDKIEHPGVSECEGPQCCIGSTCMNMPGMYCKSERGDTTCIGYSLVAAKEGVCACVHGACNGAGLCPDSPDYVASGEASSTASIAPGLPQPAASSAAGTVAGATGAAAGAAAAGVNPAQTTQLSPSSNAQFNDASGADQSGSALPLPVLIVGAVALAGILISVVVCVIKRRQGYDYYDDEEDEEMTRAPLHIAQNYPGRVKGPGH